VTFDVGPIVVVGGWTPPGVTADLTAFRAPPARRCIKLVVVPASLAEFVDPIYEVTWTFHGVGG